MAVRIQRRKYNQQNELKANVKERNSLFRILRILRVLFQILGIVPIMRNSPILIHSQKIWCILLLVIIWISCIDVMQILPETFTSIEKGFYICEMMFNAVIPLNIYYMTFVKNQRFLKIYENCIKIFEQLKMCRGIELRSYTPVYRILKREIFLLFFFITSFYVFSISIIAIRNSEYPFVVLEFYWAFIMPNILISNHLCLFWLALRFISLSYSYMNNILKEFKGTCSISSDPKCLYISSSLWYRREFCSFNYKKTFKFNDIFITLTSISTNLDHLMSEVIDIFHRVLILNFLNSFAILAVQAFSVYKYFDDPDIRGLLVFLVKFARLLLHIFNTILILWSNNTIVEEVSF